MWWSDPLSAAGKVIGPPVGMRIDPEPRSVHRSPRGDRGRALRTATTLALVGALASCGFHLRGDADFPFETIFVNVPSSPPMAAELTRAIGAESKAKVVETAAGAEVVLEVPIVVDDKDVLSLSSGGSVREYALVKRVAFRLHDKNGADWMPAGEVIVRRSYTFNETQVLARELQEQRLLREMQTDAVQQIVRRLQTARKPA